MNAETFCEHFATFADAPNGVERLRALIQTLAVKGTLVPQDPCDEPRVNFSVAWNLLDKNLNPRPRPDNERTFLR